MTRSPFVLASAVAAVFALVGLSAPATADDPQPAAPQGVAAITELPAISPAIHAAMQSGRFAEAVTAIDTFLERARIGDPETLAYLKYLRIRALTEAEAYDAAIAACDSFEKNEANTSSRWAARVRFARADVHSRQRNYEKAAAIYRAEADRLLSDGRRDELAAISLEYANRYFEGVPADDPSEAKQPDYAKAKTYYAEALELEPSEEVRRMIEFRIARSHQELGEHDAAINAYRKWIADYSPDYAPNQRRVLKRFESEVRYEVGRALLAAGRRGEARRALQDFVASEFFTMGHPDLKAQAAYRIGLTYGLPAPNDTDDLELGVAAHERFLKEFPEHALAATAEFDIARSLIHLGRFDAAIERLTALVGNEAYAGKSEVAKARRQIGEVYLRQQKFDEAIAAWKAFLEAHPTDSAWAEVQQGIVNAEYAKAAHLRSEKQYAEARKAWETFLNKYPLDSRAPRILLEFGQMPFEQAVAKVQAEREAAGANADENAVSDEAKALFEAAIADWRRLVQKYPGTEPASAAAFRVATTLEDRLGRLEDALAAYKKVPGQFAGQAQQRIRDLTEKNLELVTERKFRSNEKPTVRVVTRNLEKVTVKTYRVDLADYFRKMQTATGLEGLDIALIDPDVTAEHEVADYEKYRRIVSHVPVPLDGPGVVAVTITAGDLESTTMVVVSDLDVIGKGSRNELFVFAENTRQQKPLEGVSILVSNGEKVFGELASAADGVARNEFEELKSANELRVFAEHEGHVAFTTVSLEGLEFAAGLTAKGYLYTERPVYRPGQLVHLKGIVRRVEGDRFTFEPGSTYRLDVYDPRSRRLLSKDVTLDEFGSVADHFLLPSAVPNGNCRIHLHQPGGDESYDTAFQVANFQLEPVRIQVETERPVYYRGETINGSISLAYQYGTPLAEKAIRYRIADGPWRDGTTNAEGNVEFTFETRTFRESTPLSIVVHYPDRNLASSKTVFIATRGFAIATTTLRSVYIAGETFDVTTRVVDPAGKPVATDLVLDVLELVDPGKGRDGEKRIARHELKSDDEGKATHTVKLDEAGRYLLRFSGKDRFDNEITGGAIVSVSGDDDTVRLRILAEKHGYEVGDEAKLQLHWRNEPALALVTYEGARILGHRLVQLKTGENELAIPVAAELAPNFVLGVAVMDVDSFHQARSEFLVRRRLKIDIKPSAATLEPGAELTVDITTTDPQGNPVPAAVSLGMVERSLLERFGNGRPVVETFFGDGRRRPALRAASSVAFEYRPKTEGVSEFLLAENDRRNYIEAQREARERLVRGDLEQARRFLAGQNVQEQILMERNGNAENGEFAKLVGAYNQLMRQKRFSEAEAVARQARAVDPNNPVGETLFYKARIAQTVSEFDRLEGERTDSYVQTQQDIFESANISVNGGGVIEFPARWDELTRRRINVKDFADPNSLDFSRRRLAGTRIFGGAPGGGGQMLMAGEAVHHGWAATQMDFGGRGIPANAVPLSGTPPNPNAPGYYAVPTVGAFSTGFQWYYVPQDANGDGTAGSLHHNGPSVNYPQSHSGAGTMVFGVGVNSNFGRVPDSTVRLMTMYDTDGLPEAVGGIPGIDARRVARQVAVPLYDFQTILGSSFEDGPMRWEDASEFADYDSTLLALNGRGEFLAVNGLSAEELEKQGDDLQLLPSQSSGETGYWNPGTITDAKGKATLTFRLPERSTVWTLRAVGTTKETLTGEAAADVTAVEKVFAEVRTPLAFHEGDTAEILVDVHDSVVKKDEEITVVFSATIGDRTSKVTKTLKATGREGGDVRELAFPVAITAGDEVVFEVAVTSGENRSTTTETVPVLPYGLPVFATASGTASQTTLAFVEHDARNDVERSSLQIVIGPGIERTLVDAVLGRSVIDCGFVVENGFARSISDVIGGVAVLEAVRAARDADSPDLRLLTDRIRSRLAEIVAAQRDDGGWSWSGTLGHGSDAGTTADALWALSAARRAGFAVPNEATANAVSFLQNATNNTRDRDHQARYLHALAEADAATFAAANRLYRERTELSPEAVLSTALVLARLDREAMATELLSGVELPANDTDATRLGLYLLALGQLLPGDEATPKIAERLMQSRRGTRWTPERANGPAIAALARWHAKADRVDEKYTLGVFVNDRLVEKLEIDPARDGSRRISVDPAFLEGKEKHRVNFDMEGRGTFSYSVVLEGFVPADKVKSTTDEWSVARVYEPTFRMLDGRAVPRGFGIARTGTKTFRNPLTQLPVGERGHVTLEIDRKRVPSDEPRDYLVVTEPIPAGASVPEDSISGAFERYEFVPGGLRFHVGQRVGKFSISYGIVGYEPGEYRAVPTTVRSHGTPDRMAVSKPTPLTVLARGEESVDEYQLTPVELFEYGKRYVGKEDFDSAWRHFEPLYETYELQADPARELVRLMFQSAIALEKDGEIVEFFEILRQRDPSFVIGYRDVLRVAKAYAELGEYERSYLVYRATIEGRFSREVQIVGWLAEQGEYLRSVGVMENLLRAFPAEAYVATATYALSQEVYGKAAEAAGDEKLREAGITRVDLLAASVRMVDHFLTAWPKDPAADEASFALANTLLDLERFEEVVERARAYVERYPESRMRDGFWFLVGYGQFALGASEKALETCAKVAEMTRIDAETGRELPADNKWQAIYIMGQVYHSLGRPARAIEEYERVRDRFADAAEAITFFTRRDLQLPEVTAVAPGEATKPELSFRNVANVNVKVYRIDLLKFGLLQRDLSKITSINLAGIKPFHDATVKLGDGKDYRDRTSELALPLKEEGAYLVVCRGDDLYTSGLVLVSPLELKVAEDVGSKRVRVTVKDRRDEKYVKDVHVKVIGASNEDFTSGETDLRGVFLADDIQGTVTVIAKEKDAFAFYRGPRREPEPAPDAAKPEPEAAPNEADGKDLLQNLRMQNGFNNSIQRENYRNLLDNKESGVEAQKAL